MKALAQLTSFLLLASASEEAFPTLDRSSGEDHGLPGPGWTPEGKALPVTSELYGSVQKNDLNHS